MILIIIIDVRYIAKADKEINMEQLNLTLTRNEVLALIELSCTKSFELVQKDDRSSLENNELDTLLKIGNKLLKELNK